MSQNQVVTLATYYLTRDDPPNSGFLNDLFIFYRILGKMIQFDYPKNQQFAPGRK